MTEAVPTPRMTPRPGAPDRATLDLGIIGMPGCDANVDIVNAVLDFVVGSPTATRAFALPATPALSGQTAYSQSLVVAAGVNPLGGLTTNGVALLLGTL